MAKTYKIKTLNNISEKGLKQLDDKYQVSSDIDNPDALLVRSAKLHDYNFTENIRFVGRSGAGVNNIPIDRCSEKGIVVANAPGANANAVKELFIFCLLVSSRRLVEAVEWTKNLGVDENVAKKVEDGKKAFVGPEISGKTLGVIGLGHVGQLVADAAVNLGMKVYGVDPFLSVKNALTLNPHVSYIEDVNELARLSDYISIHVPFSENTKNYISKELIDNMKDGVRLINLARGELVDRKALKVALEAGKVGKYVVDFPDELTMTMPNTINLPHIGASTPESEEMSASLIVSEMIDFLENGNIKNSVNFPNVDMGICNTKHRVSVMHKNIPNMIGQITSILADENLNIANLINAHKKDWAYTMIDIDDRISENLKEKLYKINGVVKVRLIK